MSLNAYKFDPSYGHKFYFFRHIISNIFKYIMSQELPPSISMWYTSRWLIVAIMTKGDILFGIPLTFYLVRKPSIDISRLLANMLPPFLLMIINFMIFFVIVPFDEAFSWGTPPIYLTIILVLLFYLFLNFGPPF